MLNLITELSDVVLTFKAPVRGPLDMSTALVVHCIYLLTSLTNASTEANNVDRLILVYNVCIGETSKTFQQRIKQTTFVVISA